ncbi:hypothetical protein [Parvularcula dongshanensis]|uniref:Uncharacterized protein n=1 Tax=Parvularcula dongshanensis TaxID=1173995 RepID=A0A840I6D0_9PROT|nr:hypothetical protein [Parvularcula dongshanensis]MBB4659992.1 hypothetical protein [Parvularcula dongshanensis]
MTLFEDGNYIWRRPVVAFVPLSIIFGGLTNPAALLWLEKGSNESYVEAYIRTLPICGYPSILALLIVFTWLSLLKPTPISLFYATFFTTIFVAAFWIPLSHFFGSDIGDWSLRSFVEVLTASLLIAGLTILGGMVFWLPAALAGGLIFRLIAFRYRLSE